jgi:hypothetical protein
MRRPRLTAIDLIELRAYAAKHGRTWKSHLRDEWMRASTIGPLQALRNSHGHRWLISFKLPAQVTAAEDQHLWEEERDAGRPERTREQLISTAWAHRTNNRWAEDAQVVFVESELCWDDANTVSSMITAIVEQVAFDRETEYVTDEMLLNAPRSIREVL